jgi:hypothetical protein
MKSTTTILLIVSLMASLWCSDVFGQGATNTGALQATIRDPDFWLGTSVNVIGTGLFVTRVHAPKAARWFGHGTKLLGIPALTLSIIDIHQKTTDLATWANLAYATWAMGATAIDNVFKVNYRHPMKPVVMVPYVVLYYSAIGFQGVAQYRNGWLPWSIVGFTCLLNVSSSFYARAKGAD